MTLPGRPLPPRGAPPLPQPPGGAGITSPHRGDRNDPLRLAILALQDAAEREVDDQDIAQIHKAIVIVQGVLANNAKDADAAMGVTPALRHVRRVSGGNY